MGPPRSPVLVRSVKMELGGNPFPIARRFRLAGEQSLAEVVIQSYHPMCSGDLGIRDDLKISLHGRYRFRRRRIGDPNGLTRVSADESQESGVGIDPRRAAGGGFSGPSVLNLNSRPDALIGPDHRRR